MASAHGFLALTNKGITYTSLPQRYHLFISQFHWKLTVQSCSWVSVTTHNIQNPRLFKSVELDRFLTSDDEDQMSEEVKSKHDVVNVVDLLLDTNCVGLKPNFSMIEKVISLYWDMGKNERAVLFVKEFLRREIAYREDGMEGHKGGPTGYLAWKMMANGKYRNAANLVIDLRESGLRPEIYCYVMAMTAMVKDLNELAKALCNLKGFRSLV
ncbi:hypothetical protein ACSBR2_002227 [Camellia fascicularis]